MNIQHELLNRIDDALHSKARLIIEDFISDNPDQLTVYSISAERFVEISRGGSVTSMIKITIDGYMEETFSEFKEDFDFTENQFNEMFTLALCNKIK